MALLVLIGRPLVLLADSLVRNNAVVPGVTSLIRWQSHWHVVRQSWPFFQNDFAGRIANRVMQTGNALRECVVSSIRAIWYIAHLRHQRARADGDRRLAPGGADAAVVRRLHRSSCAYFVPRMRDLAKTSSEAALARDGPRRRQLHQHPHRQAVRARARRGRLRARGDRRAPGAIAAHMRLITRFMFDALDDERAAAGRHRGDRHLAVERRARSAPASSPPRCRSPGRSPTSRAG